jgi:conjugal transfer mating pair stabilization protein TraN
MGNDCVTQPAERNTDFAHAVAALNTAQFMSMDSSCAQASQGGGHYDVNTCTVFAGEPYQCKKAVGGVVDCCKTPDGVSLAEYINLIYKLNDAGAFDTAADWLSASPLRGAWETGSLAPGTISPVRPRPRRASRPRASRSSSSSNR